MEVAAWKIDTLGKMPEGKYLRPNLTINQKQSNKKL